MTHPTILEGLCRRFYPKVIPVLMAALLTRGCAIDYTNCNIHSHLVRDYVLTHSSNPHHLVLDLAQENQIVMIGEDHANDAARIFMEEMMPLLKKSDFQYLGLEIDSKYQGDMDDFLATGNTETPLFEENEFINPAYLQLLQSARDNELKVLCLDTHTNRPSSPDKLRRDEFMFRMLIYGILGENPDAKVTVYIGTGHIKENTIAASSSLGELLDEYTGGRNASIAIVRPGKHGISWVCDIPDIPTGIGFLTDDSPISELIYYNRMHIERYGSQYDAMVVAGSPW